jgi:hypothetical protein
MYRALKQKLVNGGRAARLAATTAVCSLALGGVFVLGSWSARANSAEGLTRSLGFEGVLTRNGTPLTGSQTITFRFKKASQEVCTVPNLNVDVATNGVFRTSVPLTACPESLFDGAEVRYEIVVNSETVVSDQPIYSVPYAKYAEQLGTAFCPVGYTRVATTPHGICRRGNDEVVRVGSGASAFWIDRFEASVWNQPDGAGTQYGAGLPYPSTFPVNGQAIRQNMLYAASRSGVLPSTEITWFQAMRACRASGKRLPTGEEWLEAASLTPDNGSTLTGACHVSEGPDRRNTGVGTLCVSEWGAQDMVGNVSEWTQEWIGGVGQHSEEPGDAVFWPSPYRDDYVARILASSGGGARGFPGAASRGGGLEGLNAGVFALNLRLRPNDQFSLYGFRCVIPR